MQPKVVLKEISLILLHNPPACLPFALCSFKSMEHTFPHSRPRPWCNDKPDTTEHSGGNGEEFSHGKWLVMVAVRALLRAGTQTQPQVPANTPLLHPSPPAHQWISLRFVCALNISSCHLTWKGWELPRIPSASSHSLFENLPFPKMVEGRRDDPYTVNLTPPLGAQHLSVNNCSGSSALMSLKLTLSSRHHAELLQQASAHALTCSTHTAGLRNKCVLNPWRAREYSSRFPPVNRVS